MSNKPTKPKTPSHDTVVKVTSHPTCPNCKTQFEFIRHLAIATESYPDVERNELGIPILDEKGKPTLKTRISHEYIAIPRVITTEEMEEELKILTSRRDPEMEILQKAQQILEEEKYKKKNPKPQTIAELAA